MAGKLPVPELALVVTTFVVAHAVVADVQTSAILKNFVNKVVVFFMLVSFLFNGYKGTEQPNVNQLHKDAGSESLDTFEKKSRGREWLVILLHDKTIHIIHVMFAAFFVFIAHNDLCMGCWALGSTPLSVCSKPNLQFCFYILFEVKPASLMNICKK